MPSSAWIDDYFEWSLEPRCCRQFDNNSFCGRDVEDGSLPVHKPVLIDTLETTIAPPFDIDDSDYSYGDINFGYDDDVDVVVDHSVDFEDDNTDYYDEYDYSYGDRNPMFDYDAPGKGKATAHENVSVVKTDKLTSATDPADVPSETTPVTETSTTVSPFITNTPVNSNGATIGGVKHMDDGWPDYKATTDGERRTSGGSTSSVTRKKLHHSGKHNGSGDEKKLTGGRETTDVSIPDRASLRVTRQDTGGRRVGNRRKQRKQLCHACPIQPMPLNPFRPDPEVFDEYLPMFLKDNPDMKCPKAGHAAYGQVRNVPLWLLFTFVSTTCIYYSYLLLVSTTCLIN